MTGDCSCVGLEFKNHWTRGGSFTTSATGRNFAKIQLPFHDADAAVFHLTPVSFETDGAGGGYFHIGIEDFAVAGAVSRIPFHSDDHFIPVLRFVIFQIFIRSGQRIISALELGFPDEDPTVRIWSGSEFQLQDKILGKCPGSPELLDSSIDR